MSIWATGWSCDDWNDDNDPPLFYGGSHLIPSIDEIAGGVDLAHIPTYTAEARDVPYAAQEYLRLSVQPTVGADSATVVLTRKQITGLCDYLLWWLITTAEGGETA